jgi:hypothetical protein
MPLNLPIMGVFFDGGNFIHFKSTAVNTHGQEKIEGKMLGRVSKRSEII